MRGFIVILIALALVAPAAAGTRSTIKSTIAAAVALYQAQCGGVRGHCDPWPNCPDPYDGSGSWQDTKNCESRGYSWSVDPPGYYCGPLQMDPVLWRSIIRRYSVPCR